MTKQKTLFRKEVYDKLENIASGLSGVETALQLIRRDEKLQKFLQQYAKKHGIYTCNGNCYVGMTAASGSDRAIHFWNNEKRVGYRGVWDSELYIGPHSEREVSPIFLRHSNTSNHGPYPTPEIVEKEDGFYVEDPHHGDKGYGEVISKYHGQRITKVNSLVNVSAQTILCGLEKAITKIMGEKD